MKFSAALLTSALALTTTAAPAAAPDSSLDARANLPGLNKAQSAHATAIIAETKKEGLGRQGCLAAITTGLVESNILVYANKGVPSSLKYPHDAVGSDHDSVGVSVSFLLLSLRAS